jgi:hypothetical protein
MMISSKPFIETPLRPSHHRSINPTSGVANGGSLYAVNAIRKQAIILQPVKVGKL